MVPPAPRPPWPWLKLLALAGSVLVLAALALRYWRQGPDLVVDFEHELYVPWRMTQGAVLYRDLFWTMGPVSPVYHAALFRFLGVGVDRLLWSNLVIIVGVAGLLYALLTRLASWRLGVLAVQAFLCLFAFAQYQAITNYNFMTPYRQEMTHGLALCLLGLVAADRALTTGRRRWLVVEGLAMGLVALMKAEIGLPLVAALVVGHASATRSWAAARRTAGWWLLAGGSVIAGFWLLWVAPLGAGGALAAIFSNWRWSFDRSLTVGFPFYRTVMGLDDWPGGLGAIAQAAGNLGAGLALALGLDYLAARFSPRVQQGLAVLAVIIAALVASTVDIAHWARAGRALPLAGLVVLALVAIRAWRQRTWRLAPDQALLAATAIFATLLAAKMGLRAWIGHIGFVLALPAFMLLLWLVAHALPSWWQTRGGRAWVYRGLLAGVLLAGTFTHLRQTDLIAAHKTTAVGSGADRFYVGPVLDAHSELFRQAMVYAQQQLPAGSSVLALPCGCMLNYLGRFPNPTPYYLLTGWELRALGGQQRVLATIQRTPPDYILLMNWDLSDTGLRDFAAPGGGDQIVAWLQQEYRPLQQFTLGQPGTPGFFFIQFWQRPPAGHRD